MDAVNEVPIALANGGQATLLARTGTCPGVGGAIAAESIWAGPDGHFTLGLGPQGADFTGTYQRIDQCGPVLQLSPDHRGWVGFYALAGRRGDTITFRPAPAAQFPFAPFVASVKSSGRNYRVLTNGDTLSLADTLRVPVETFTLRFVHP